MNEENEFIYCQKCGSKMRKSQRCCLKCGALNYLNLDNDSMEGFQKKADKEENREKKEYKFVSSEDAPDRVIYAKNAGSRTLCLFLNIFVYLLPIVYFIMFRPIPIDMNLLLDYKYSLIFLIYTYIWFFMLGLQLLYMKTDRRWWSVFIPFYDLYNWFDITMHKGWLFIFILIPPVEVVLLFVSLWYLGYKFKRNSLACLLFPYIMIPSISYNDDCIYEEVTYSFSRESEEKAIMRNYKINGGLSRYMVFVVIVTLIINSYYWGREFIKYRYVRDVKVIIENLDRVKYNCSRETSLNVAEEYYINFTNAAEQLRIALPSEYDVLYKTYAGYIRVVNVNGNKEYYISMSNGYYGVKEKNINEITKEDIIYSKSMKFKIPDNKMFCNVR